MERLARYLGAEDDWERPAPRQPAPRADVLLALAWFAVGAVGIELLRGMGAAGDGRSPVWDHLAVASAAALLVWRRSRPLTVAGLSSLHMFLTGVLLTPVMVSLPMQLLYFFALFSGVAWARERRLLAYVVTGVVTLMFCWLAWQFALGSGVEEIRSNLGVGPEDHGLIPPVASALGYTFLINVMYFGGAVALGQLAWRAARRNAQVLEQAVTIRGQAERLRDQAVVAERLRIARELHDVVAHHVSTMGVQAAAAGRVLERDPAAARAALGAVSTSSREAVAQMRDLLGTLRGGEMAAGGTTPERARAPQPTLADVAQLVAEAREPGREVEHLLVEERPGAVDAIPSPLQLTGYRVVQEALANIRRHSTATHVTVTVRVADTLEIEVVDDGSPRSGTRGTGLGLVGIRERAQILGGTAETGPRHARGFRVRVVLPVSARTHERAPA